MWYTTHPPLSCWTKMMRMKSMYPTRHNYLADMLFLKLLPYCTFRRWRLALPGGDYRRQEVVTQIVDLVDFAGSSPSFLGRERAAVNVDVRNDGFYSKLIMMMFITIFAGD